MSAETTRTEEPALAGVDRARRATVEAFARAGTILDGSSQHMIEEVGVDALLAEIADKAAGSWEEARRGDDGPVAVIDHLLTVTRALRVACGFTATPQACDVNETIKQKNIAEIVGYINAMASRCPGCNELTVPAFEMVGFNPYEGAWQRFNPTPDQHGMYQFFPPGPETGGKFVAMLTHHRPGRPGYTRHVCKTGSDG